MEQFQAKTCLYAEENPYDAPEISALCLEYPPKCFFKTPQDDCFSRLPWEILEAIAILLPTNDALSLCYVSTAFLSLLSNINNASILAMGLSAQRNCKTLKAIYQKAGR